MGIRQTNRRSGPSRFALRRLLPASGRTWVTPVVTLLMLLGIIAGAVIISSVTNPHVHLDDGTVWVTSLNNRKAARLNVRLAEPDGAVSSSAARFDVAQHDADMVLAEGTKATGFSASTLSIAGRTQITSAMDAQVGGDTIAFLDSKSGKVWTGLTSKLDAVSPTSSEPRMTLGAGGRIALTHDGKVYGYRPSDGSVLVIDDPQSSSPRTLLTLSDGRPAPADDFTVIDGVPIIVANGVITWSGGTASTGSSERLVLQSPDTDGRQSGWVAAAGAGTLYLADLNASGQARRLASGGDGEAAKPVSTSGCVHAAWAQSARNYIRACDRNSNEKAFESLPQVGTTSDLVFRTNHRLVILNDRANGNVWNPDVNTDLIKIQWNKIQTEQTSTKNSNDQSANNQRRFSRTCSAQSGQIKAQDDQLQARAGGHQILDVLRNDQQTDCSVLTITKVGAPDGASIAVSPIYDGRFLQLDASKATAGTVTFSYDISDGRGQTSSATVTLTIVSATGNGAPKQTDTPPEYDVEQGATYTTNALGSFSDPDGDPMTLVGATVRNSDQVVVSTRADGQLTFDAGSATGGRVAVELTVSDGRKTGTGLAYFSIRPANTLAATIDAVARRTTPGTQTTVDLKPYVHGTSAQPAQLSAADTPSGANVTVNAADLTLTFQASAPGTYYVPYTIMQGTIAATGLARMEVAPADGQNAKPVAANDVALLDSDNTAIVEPLANDVDPMGGVLSVTSVTADPSLGVKTGLVSHRRVYMTARQVPTSPVEITYTVANAAGSSQGVIVLQPPALTGSDSAPKASNINAQVRAGGIVSVNVLDHVSHADGVGVTLQNDLKTDKATFSGLAFVSGDTVRYQASDRTGVFPITYTVKDDRGNAASGTITITVHEKNASGKAAPTPADVEAQVAAGQKVRIPITLTGIDVDGDDDQLLGLGNKAPKLGRISEVGANYMVYEAYADSSGTDTFSYAVEDWTGQRAQAQIRVGVFQGASDSGVYARDDEITLRPNTAATVPVLLNDISGDNTDLHIERKLDMQGIQGAKVSDGTISFTTPNAATTGYIVYTAADKAGLSDTATLTVHVDPNAPIEPPTAYDYRVPAAATIDKKTIEVDVSPWIANPSGPIDELSVDGDASAKDHARLKGGQRSTVISVDLTEEARAVPYTVTNTKYHITSTAFIQVPAYGVFPPTLRPKAPALRVNARESIIINIADYVRVGVGKEPYVASPDSVSATKAADGDLYVDDQTLKFTAPKDYAGPASITFTAVDAKDTDKAKIVNSAVLTLPITVIGRDVPPPTFSSSTIDVVAGEEAKTIDLTALTHAPEGLYEDEKAYTYAASPVSGPIEAKVSAAGLLTVSAPKDANPGTTVSVPIAISYAKGTVNAGVTVQVVQSTRPLARVSAKEAKLKAGSTTSVDLLEGAYNPFPETPLSVIGCTSDDAAKLTVECPANGNVTIRAASDIGASTNTVLATIQDGTKTQARQVTASITVSVIDRPAAPLLSPISGKPADGAVDLSWTPGAANGSPITDYEVSWDEGKKSCGAVTTCHIDSLTNGKTYSFTVRARNEVGWSDPSAPVTGKPDKVPSAPGNVRVEGGHNVATVSWDRPNYEGTAPDGYTVTLTGSKGWTATQTTDGATRSQFTVPNEAIVDGETFSATVKAHNVTGDGQPSKPSDGAVVYGDPDKPTLTLTQDGDRLRISVALGQLRNAGCASIDIAGDYKGVLPCDDPTDTQDIPQKALFSRQRITATLKPLQASARSSSDTKEIELKGNISKPKDVAIKAGDNSSDQCVVTWAPGDSGHWDSFTVSVNGGGTTTTNATSASFTLKPWTTCTEPKVTAKLNGRDGQGATGTGSHTYKRAAQISDVGSLSWDEKEHDLIHVTPPVYESWGQPNELRYVIIADGKSYEFSASKEHTIDAKGIPDADTYQWTVLVKGVDSALDTVSDKHDVERKRAPVTTPVEPTEPTEPDKPTEPASSTQPASLTDMIRAARQERVRYPGFAALALNALREGGL